MNNGFIAVIDSGVGGVSVLNELIKLMPGENFLYFGDNENAPYGNRSERELLYLVFNIVKYLETYKIKAMVIGCNTLSTTVFQKIKEFCKVPIFGVFPPVEKVILENDNVLLLATCRTAENFKDTKGVRAVGLSDLALDIERNVNDLSKIDFNRHFFNIEGHYDAIILGCTHYNFIKNEIYDYFCPLKIYCGETFTANSVLNYLKKTKSLVINKRFSVLFTGKFAEKNKLFFEKSGQLY